MTTLEWLVIGLVTLNSLTMFMLFIVLRMLKVGIEEFRIVANAKIAYLREITTNTLNTME